MDKDEQFNKLVKNQESYMKSIQYVLPFISTEFDGVVSITPHSLTVLAGSTGSGRSYAVANLVFGATKVANPLTGRPYKTLILSNEDTPRAYYERLTCLIKGYRPNPLSWSIEQYLELEKIEEYISKYVTILTDYDKLVGFGNTTSFSGIEKILSSIQKKYDTDNNHYDFVLIDSYSSSGDFKEQRQISEYLKQFSISYPAAVIVVGSSSKEDELTPFFVRFKGSADILHKASCVIEMVSELKLMRTSWNIHKNRFMGNVGGSVFTGFSSGRFVPYTVDFQKNVAKIIEDLLNKQKRK